MKKTIAIIIFCFLGLTACGAGGSISSGASSESSSNLFGDLDLTCGTESCME